MRLQLRHWLLCFLHLPLLFPCKYTLQLFHSHCSNVEQPTFNVLCCSGFHFPTLKSMTRTFCADVEPVRGCHHGQLRLLDTGFIYSWSASFGRVRQSLGRIRSGGNVSNFFVHPPQRCVRVRSPWALVCRKRSRTHLPPPIEKATVTVSSV